MALKDCAECGHKISSKAKTCPSCGAASKQTSFLKTVAIGFSLFCLVMCTFVSNRNKSHPPANIAPPSPEQVAIDLANEERRSAKSACRELVRESLHDPSSAELDSSLQYYIDVRKDHVYMVQVTGRAKNGFGALRKITVNCTIKKTTGGWKVVAPLKQIN